MLALTNSADVQQQKVAPKYKCSVIPQNEHCVTVIQLKN